MEMDSKEQDFGCTEPTNRVTDWPLHSERHIMKPSILRMRASCATMTHPARRQTSCGLVALKDRNVIIKRAILGFTACCLLLPAASAQQPTLSAKTQAAINNDLAHHIGTVSTHPGPRATNLSSSIQPQSVKKAMRRVASWELKQARHNFGRDWTWGTLYAGFMAAAKTLNASRYRNVVERVGNKFDWRLASPNLNPNNLTLGQSYIQIYLRDLKFKQISPTKDVLDKLLTGAAQHIPSSQAQIPWWWCDSLFMASPAWSRMYAATHNTKYLNYLDTHWWQTSGLLYDTHFHLYHRDITYLHAKSPNGKPVFWSRGEGWVMAGLVRTLEYMPEDYPGREKLEEQLRQMADEVATLQDPDTGLWHASLLDPKDFPQPETSGSALMTYALAWGVNHGVLARSKYVPVMRKAWAGLVHQIYASGRLGNVQQTGDAPAHYLPSSSYNYGVGAFLLAGSQIARLSQAPD